MSVVPATKIQSMDGGGEDSVAYILLYRSVRSLDHSLTSSAINI